MLTMFISFTDNKPDVTTVSLAYQLQIGPNVRFRTMASGTKLVYEDNVEDVLEVRVAVPTRRTLVTEPLTNERPLYGFRSVTA